MCADSSMRRAIFRSEHQLVISPPEISPVFVHTDG